MIYVVITTTKERRSRLQTCIDAVRESTLSHALIVYENLDGGCVLAIKKAIEGLDAEIFVLNDDMVIEPDCLQKLKTAYDNYYPNKDGLCQPYESIHGGNLGVSPYCHTSTIRPFLEAYIHNYYDTEFTDVMKIKNKYTMVLDAKLDHRHWSSGGAVLDHTYSLSQQSSKTDHATWKLRKNNGYPHRF